MTLSKGRSKNRICLLTGTVFLRDTLGFAASCLLVSIFNAIFSHKFFL